MRNIKRKMGDEAVKFFGVPLACVVLTAVLFSHVGWLVENVARIFLHRTIDARFYVLPFISAYGMIPFAYQAILRSPDDIRFFGKDLLPSDNVRNRVAKNVIAYIMMVIFVFLAELAVGNLWDGLLGVKLWDYSSFPLSITQYTSLPTSILLGLFGFVLYKVVYGRLLRAFCRMPYGKVRTLATVLASLIMLDTVNMILYMVIKGEAPMLWSISL
jgi:uncharacterized membrane protein